MTEKTYTAARAKRLILEKKLPADAVVVGDLYLSGCDLTGITGWFTTNGNATRMRCIAVSDYPLIQTETGMLSAGCRGPWTEKQALDHWSKRKDERAKIFTAAIQANRL